MASKPTSEEANKRHSSSSRPPLDASRRRDKGFIPMPMVASSSSKRKAEVPAPTLMRSLIGESGSRTSNATADTMTVISSTRRLLVTGLPINITIDQIKDIFSRAKAIKMVLVRDEMNRYQRNATIDFSNSDHAADAYRAVTLPRPDPRLENAGVKFDLSSEISSTSRSASYVCRETTEDNNYSYFYSDEAQKVPMMGRHKRIEDLLPKENEDRDRMVERWIQRQPKKPIVKDGEEESRNHNQPSTSSAHASSSRAVKGQKYYDEDEDDNVNVRL